MKIVYFTDGGRHFVEDDQIVIKRYLYNDKTIPQFCVVNERSGKIIRVWFPHGDPDVERENIFQEIVSGIGSGNFHGRVMKKGLPQNTSCVECVYGGESDTVNFCKRPKDEICHKQVI